MATTFSGKVSLSISGTLTPAIDIGTNKYTFSKTYSQSFTNGTGANQCNMCFTDTRSISGNDDLDLAGGLTAADGSTITFTSVKAIVIKAADANTANIVVGNEGTNPFLLFDSGADTITMQPGEVFVRFMGGANGLAVTAGTGDKLRIAPSSGTQAYDIIIEGEV